MEKFSDFLNAEFLDEKVNTKEEQLKKIEKILKKNNIKFSYFGNVIMVDRKDLPEETLKALIKKFKPMKGVNYDYNDERFKVFSTLKSVNENSNPKIKNVIKGLKEIKNVIKKYQKDAKEVFDDVFYGDPDGDAGTLLTYFNMDSKHDIDDLIDTLEDEAK